MRGQDRSGVTRPPLLLLAAAILAALPALLAGTLPVDGLWAQQRDAPAARFAKEPPRLTGWPAPMEVEPAPPLAQPLTDDIRRMRAYPEQPPVIPHSIEGYQLSLRANRCMDCHSRQYVEGSGAPMISITHYMDRDGQMLADVSPRRYFCAECHVQQTDAGLLVGNGFRDMLESLPEPSADDGRAE